MSNLAIAESVTAFADGWTRPFPSRPVTFQSPPKPLQWDSPLEDWERLSLSTPFLSRQLPLEDNEPLETNAHRVAMNTLIRSLKHHWADRTDFFVGGNMFVYFNPAQQRRIDYRGPDFFVALGVPKRSRQAWFAWDENGKLPDVIVELLSDSTKATDLGLKKTLYEQRFKTTDYLVFDPLDANSLRGWHLSPATGQYEELVPNEHGRLWSAKLELWIGVWEGAIDGEVDFWLRFYDVDGQLVRLPEEAARQEAQAAKQKAQIAEQKAKEASQRAEQLAEHLRRLGIDPDRLS